MITTPDVEVILPPLVYGALYAEWEGIYVGRAKPAKPRPFIVTIQRAGGIGPSRFVDSARLLVNVWAARDVDANRLAEDVRNVLEHLAGTPPFIDVTASGASAIYETGEQPQRFLYADALMKRSTTT